MRTSIVSALLLGLAGCYQPGDLGDIPFDCTAEQPECPDGYTCADGAHCTRDTGSSTGNLTVAIPKTGQPYTGPHTADPQLANGACPSQDIGRVMSQATILSTGGLTNLAICKPGDINLFRIPNAAGVYPKVVITYEVAHGDLDLAFIDGDGKLIGTSMPFADGTAVSTGCIALPSPASGDVYLAVVGASNKETGSYSIRLSTSSSAPHCP